MRRFFHMLVSGLRFFWNRYISSFCRAVKPAVDIIVPIALVWFAFSTDRVYHRLADISFQQAQIMATQNDPLFSGVMELFENPDTHIFDTAAIKIKNIGAPVDITASSLVDVLKVRLERPGETTKLYVVPVTGYFKFFAATGEPTGFVLRSEQSASYNKFLEIYKSLTKDGYKGWFASVEDGHYVAITYLDRTHNKRTDYFEVSAFGMRQVDKRVWVGLVSDQEKWLGQQFDFDTCKPASFPRYLEKVIASTQG